MRILRQKSYSDAFIPSIPVGNISNLLYLSWPARIILRGIRHILGLFRRLASVFRYIVSSGSVKKHTTKDKHELVATEKNFSDIPLNSKLEDYEKLIPEYAKLASLYRYNHRILEKFTDSNKKIVYDLLPGYLCLMGPDKINKFRQEYIESSSKDYAEILFMCKGELTFIYDFDESSWYVMDHTYKPAREWKIKDGRLFDQILQIFDVNKNELLKKRIEIWKEVTNSDFAESYIGELIRVTELVKNK